MLVFLVQALEDPVEKGLFESQIPFLIIDCVLRTKMSIDLHGEAFIALEKMLDEAAK